MTIHGSLQSHTDTVVFTALGSCIEQMQARSPSGQD